METTNTKALKQQAWRQVSVARAALKTYVQEATKHGDLLSPDAEDAAALCAAMDSYVHRYDDETEQRYWVNAPPHGCGSAEFVAALVDESRGGEIAYFMDLGVADDCAAGLNAVSDLLATLKAMPATLENAADLLRRGVAGELEDYERVDATEHADYLEAHASAAHKAVAVATSKQQEAP